MDDIRHVRKRIKNRRFDPQDTREQHSIPLLFRLFYHGVMVMMGICVFVLALLVNQKLQLVQVPAVLETITLKSIDSFLPFEHWFSLKDDKVSATPQYTLLKDDQYTTGTNAAISGFDGIVAYIQQGNDKKSSVIIKQDNGVMVTYGNLQDVSIEQEERVLKGATLGTYEGFVRIKALKNNAAIDVYKRQEFLPSAHARCRLGDC